MGQSDTEPGCLRDGRAAVWATALRAMLLPAELEEWRMKHGRGAAAGQGVSGHKVVPVILEAERRPRPAHLFLSGGNAGGQPG